MRQTLKYPSPPVIPSLAESMKRLLWSVMISVYNCYQTLDETLASVLMQDRGKDLMQIEVIDDASTNGNVEKLVEHIGKGRLGYFKLGLSNCLSFSVQDDRPDLNYFGARPVVIRPVVDNHLYIKQMLENEQLKTIDHLNA